MLKNLKVKIYADGAELSSMLDLYQRDYISGFTTNPSLMRKAGIENYEQFAKEVVRHIPDRPVSFEVFADELDEMEAQAKYIASWGEHVYVKIPIVNTKGISTVNLINKLASVGVKLNITAIMTTEQIEQVSLALDYATPAIVSLFAGRIADTGVDPIPVAKRSLAILANKPKAMLLWASTREILNIVQADAIGCHIITVPHSMLNKLQLLGYDLTTYSRDTVKTFYTDAKSSGFSIQVAQTEVV